jgi:large subunit ribosomal protein L15
MTIGLNNLSSNKGEFTGKTRVGRGIGCTKGKTCGRGVKGQKARSGVAIKGFEGGQMPIHRRLPKRGFNNPTRVAYESVNLWQLEGMTGNITLDAIRQRLGISVLKNIKLLSGGDAAKGVSIEVQAASKSAIAKVEAAGGKVSIVYGKEKNTAATTEVATAAKKAAAPKAEAKPVAAPKAAPKAEAAGDIAKGGLDINIADLAIGADNTLQYGGQRVTLYIKDQSNASASNLPKYHVAACATLKAMKESGKEARYVVTNREDGLFEMDFKGDANDGDHKLDECQNCIKKLNANKDKKQFDGATFNLKDFYAEYPKTV